MRHEFKGGVPGQVAGGEGFAIPFGGKALLFDERDESGSSADGKAPPMVMLADTRSAMIRLLKMMVGGKRGRVQPARARPSRSLRERFVPGIGIRLGGPGRLDLGMGGYGADAAPRGVGGRREAQIGRAQV